MQNTFFNGRIGPMNRMAAARDEGFEVKIALVYQENHGRQAAERVRDEMAAVAGKKAVVCTEWKIGDLAEQGAFSESVAGLARADVIVVSVSEPERLPAAYYRWVNLWLEERAGLPGLLIALVPAVDSSRPATKDALEYLQALAKQGGLEFLSQDCDRPARPACIPEESLLAVA
jgi:hypothetical protein